MDWIREWILQIVGVIVLSCICDMIMLEGNMKKYVRPILGFILIFIIVRPVSAISEDKLRLDILMDSVGQVDTITMEIDGAQREYIADMYEKKLGERMVEELSLRYGLSTKVRVMADRKTENIGGIEAVKLTISTQSGEVINTESIKRYIAEKFGVDDKIVQVTLRER